MPAFLTLFLSFCLALKAASLDVIFPESQIEFLAIGRPSALKIRGKIKEDSAPAKPLEGKWVLKESAITGQVSLKLSVLDTGIALRDRHMKEKYLETEKFPTAHFTLSKLSLPADFPEKLTNVKDLPFEADLKLHGRSKLVRGVAEVGQDGSKLELTLHFKVLVTDFGIEIPSYLGIKVADEVTVKATSKGTLKSP